MIFEPEFEWESVFIFNWEVNDEGIFERGSRLRITIYIFSVDPLQHSVKFMLILYYDGNQHHCKFVFGTVELVCFCNSSARKSLNKIKLADGRYVANWCNVGSGGSCSMLTSR